MIKEIVKGIWIGGEHDCYRLRHVLYEDRPTIHLGECCTPHKDDSVLHRYYQIRDIDEDAPKILDILKDCKDFITKYQEEPLGVLIHCTAGMSRSPTLAFLYLHEKNPKLKTTDFKNMYPSWFPNLGFTRLFRELGID
jgi:predicted protein tyrosine phosphatase